MTIDLQDSGQEQAHGRITMSHVLVVVSSLLLTITAWQYSKIQIERKTQLAYEAAREQTVGLSEDRMKKYEDALWAGVAAVESHGGDIAYRGFQDGVVYLTLQGACAGCPSSTATLKHGIESLLKHYVPEVEEVRAA